MATELLEYKHELNKLLKTKTKIRLIGADIHFLKKCIKHQVIPTFAKINTRTKNTNINYSKSVNFAQEKYLKLEIINHYRNRNKLEIQAYLLHLKLSKNLHRSQWDIFQEKMTNVVDHKFESKKNIHMKKFDSLIFEKNKMKENKNSKDHQNNLELFQEWEKDLVKNYTVEIFTKNELDILKMGCRIVYGLIFIQMAQLIRTVI